MHARRKKSLRRRDRIACRRRAREHPLSRAVLLDSRRGEEAPQTLPTIGVGKILNSFCKQILVYGDSLSSTFDGVIALCRILLGERKRKRDNKRIRS